MKRRLLAFVIGVSLAFSACQEELEPTPLTYTRVFTGEVSKTWKLTIMEETQDGKVIDRFTVNCANDDRFIFYATSDRLYEVKSGNQKCFAGEPATFTDTWSFNNATATLTIVIPFLADSRLPFIVKDVDKDDMELEIFFDEQGTGSYKLYFELIDEE
jgi:hypothetical protein